MVETLTPHWIICCRLVLDMKGRIVRQGILALTAVAIVVTVGTVATVKNPDPAENQQEIVQEQTSVQYSSTPPVNNSVENVEDSQEIVNNSVNDVHNSVEEPAYTEEQLEILAIIIYQEAGGDFCSDDTRRKVGSVFLNRVNSPLFPDTFEEVATAERQYGTLYWTGIKWPDRASYEQEARAVQRAYDIAEELLADGSILPTNVIWQAEFPQGDGTYCYQDGLYFCYSEVNE